MAERPARTDELPAPFSVGKVIGGKYRVERRLGAGNMGIVVAAQHTELGESVALKILNPELKSNKEALARFTREAKAMFSLRSEHVGRVFDVGKLDTGEPFIVMELLRGQTLKELLDETQRPLLAEALLLMKQLCEAVGEAHAAGIVHRDLKPENIFVTRNAGLVHAKVIDFGVSKARFGASDHTLTDVEAVLGTPRYMAPEQFLGPQLVDARSDVWALGVLFYRVLTGQFPFDAKDVAKHIEQIKTKRPPPPHTLQRDVPAALSDVIMRCLSVAREPRFANARELGVAIEVAVPLDDTADARTKREPQPEPTKTSAAVTAPPLSAVPTSTMPSTMLGTMPATFREEATIPRAPSVRPPAISTSDDPTTAYTDVPTARRGETAPSSAYADVPTVQDTTMLRRAGAVDDPQLGEQTLARPATRPDDELSTARRDIPTIARPLVAPNTRRLPTPGPLAPMTPNAGVSAATPLGQSAFPPAQALPAPERRAQEWSSVALALTFGAIAATLGIVAFVRWHKPAEPPPPPITITNSTATATTTSTTTTNSRPTSEAQLQTGGEQRAGAPATASTSTPTSTATATATATFRPRSGGNAVPRPPGSAPRGVNDKGW